MSHELFTDLSVEQQEVVAGGLSAADLLNSTDFNQALKAATATYGVTSVTASTPTGSTSALTGNATETFASNDIITKALNSLGVKI